MARISTTLWGHITGDASSFAYRPLFGTTDVVYRKSEVAQAAPGGTIVRRPYAVLRVGYKTNAAGAPLNQSGAAISGAVASQATAPWVYDVREIRSGETVASASGPIIQEVLESDLAALADIKTYIGTEVGDWADPAAS